MIGISGIGSSGAAMLALTALERWSAARRVDPRSAEDYSSILAITLLLLALVVLLWWVSHKRSYVPSIAARDLFSDGAARRGLSGRERQLLVAIVARSGLRRSHDVFITPDAFDQGAAKLLEQCAVSRTPPENERLRTEVANLRERLAYRTPGKNGQAMLSDSHDIAAGATVELFRQSNPDSAEVAAVVIRNDDLEIAVDTRTPVASAVGETWWVRYRLGVDIWQLEASAVSCEDRRLVLTQGGPVHAVDHVRAAPMPIHAPAMVGRFPFIQTAAMELEDGAPTDWFELVRGVVTQVSQSSLEIQSPLQVLAGERILVLFAVTPAIAGEAADGTERRGHVVGHVGRVKHRQAAGEETLIRIDLTDLTGPEVEELMRLARASASSAGGSTAARVMQGA